MLWYWSQLRYQVGATQGHLISVQVVKWDPDHNQYIKQWEYIFIFCISLNLPTYKRAQVHNVISSPRQYLYGAAHSCFWSEAHLLQQAFAESRFVNNRTLTTQASVIYCRCSGSPLRRFYLHFCTTSFELHPPCFIAELVSQPRFPKYLKRRWNETGIIRLTVL